MTKTQLAAVALVLLASPTAQAQTHSLSVKFGGTGADDVSALARDSSQRLVVAGRYSDQLDLGGGNFVATGDNDNYLAVFDEQGNHVWSRNLIGTAPNIMHAIAVEASGDIVLVGDGSGTLNLGGGDLSLSTDGAFAARYDADGNHLWSRTVAVGPGSDANDVAFDPDGNIVISGQELLFDSSVVELDADGNGLWQNGNSAVGEGIAVDFLGNVYAAGVYSYGTTFGDSMITGVGILDGFLVSYDDVGNLRWFRAFNDNSWCGAQDVAVDLDSNVWLSGFYTGILDFGAGAIQSSGGFETFLSVFDSGDGNALCTQSLAGGGSVSDYANSRLGTESGAVLAADFYNSVDTGADVLNSAGGKDFCVVAFNSPCSPSWSIGVGGTGDDGVEDLDLGQGPVVGLPALENGGSSMKALSLPHGIVVAGAFEQSVDFGGGLLTSNGLSDGFVAHYLVGPSAAPPVPGQSAWMRAVPNPWNPTTTIYFDLPRAGAVTLELFDSRGRRVRTLLTREHRTAGEHQFELVGGGLASGVYQLRLVYAGGKLQQSVALLK